MATTSIILTAKDATGAAFASANSNISGLASSALKLSGVLGTIGAGAAVGAIGAFVKSTLDAQDSLSKLSQKTGIAVESLAGLEFAAEQSGVELEKVAKATRAFGLLVAESADSTSGASDKLRQLGLSYKDLKDLSPEKQLLALADALQKFGKEDRAVALTATLGQKMADLIPLLSGGSKELGTLIEQGKKYNPVTEQSAKDAEKFNDQMNALSKSAGSLGRAMVQDLIPGFTRISQAMTDAAKSGGFLSVALAGVKQLFTESFGNPKILGDVGQIRREIMKTQETIGTLSGKKDSVFFDKNALIHEQEKLAALEVSLQKAIGVSRESLAATDANTEGTKKFAIAIDDSNIKLKKNNDAENARKKAIDDAMRVEHEYVTLLKIERQARQDLLKPYQDGARSAKERVLTLRDEQQALRLSRTNQISMQQAIEETTISRLEEKRAITKDTEAVAAIEQEIAARREIIGVIKQSELDTENLGKINKIVTDDVSQLWTQAGRNIQSSLASGIFNFFDDGLKGMLKNVASTVGRIMSEFAALRLAQGIGLAGMFGAAGSASAAGSAISGGSILSGAANIGSNALGLVRGGFGLGGLLSGGGAFSNLGGAGTAFIGGPGTALGGSGLGGAASAGAGFAAVAGPAIALFAVDAIGRLIGGDKKLGGAEKIPVIGGFLAGLFGRGPMKFRQQSLQGDFSQGGFDGEFTNVFRSKGGLFRSNGHKSVQEELSTKQQQLFDDTVTGLYSSSRKFAENLGLSTSLVDTFTKEIQIKSEKGKTITEEAIAEMFAGFADSLAANVIPGLEQFGKGSERLFETFERLNSEFSGLTAGAQNLGASVEYAKELITGMSISARTEFVDAAGGIEALGSKTSFFFQNFLNQSEQFAVKSSALADGLKKLGLSADTTIDQFKALVQATGTSNELRIGLLDLAPAFLEVKSAVQETAASIESVRDNVALLSADFAKNSLASAISLINNEIDKLVTFAESLKSTVDDIQPQSLNSARDQIIEATNAAKSGKITDVSGALSTISGQTSAGFSNRRDFELSKSLSVSLISKLAESISGSINFRRASIADDTNRVSKLQSFASGGVVPRTGLALIHKDERVINPQQNEAIVDLLKIVADAVKSSGYSTDQMYSLLRNMTNNGTALNTVVTT